MGEERKKERKKAEKELSKLRASKNKEWREKREEERIRKNQETLEEYDDNIVKDDNVVEEALRNELKCPVCEMWMLPPVAIYQCEDGHALCEKCLQLMKKRECPKCLGQIVGRNILVENVAAIVFSKDVAFRNLEEE